MRSLPGLFPALVYLLWIALGNVRQTLADEKLVVAHIIVGNTYPYSIDDWKQDYSLASSALIDGFALNIGSESWYFSLIELAFSSALGTGFKLFFSFDMTSFPCSAPDHASLIRDYINKYASHPNYLHYDGKPLVSTFGGEYCTFGVGNLNDGWNFAIRTNMQPLYFIPSFFIAPERFSGLPVMDGGFNWNSGWPLGNYDISFDFDQSWISNLGGRTYMAAVSPWFFTHYGPDRWNKNFILRSDNWLLAERMEMVIQNPVGILQIVTWNDYGESHYIGPIKGAQPYSEAWVNGFDHQGWLDLLKYYIEAYKTGVNPVIERDRVFMWARLYPAGADAPDGVGRPRNWEYTQDYVWIVLFLPEDAEVTMICGDSTQTTDASFGVSKHKLPLINECNVHVIVRRWGFVVLDFSPPGFTFRTNPPNYNFNVLVAASP